MRLAETLDKSKDQIRRLLNKLKRTNDITTTRIGCATLVRLINYNKYQGFEDITPDPTATCSPDESRLIADYPPTTEKRKQGNNVNNEKKLVEPAIFEQMRIEAIAEEQIEQLCSTDNIEVKLSKVFMVNIK